MKLLFIALLLALLELVSSKITQPKFMNQLMEQHFEIENDSLQINQHITAQPHGGSYQITRELKI